MEKDVFDSIKKHCAKKGITVVKEVQLYTEEEDIVSRYKILFHDAPPSRIEQLIRKLIREIKKEDK